MTINQFEDIKSWQKSKELTLYIYKKFAFMKDFGFRDQIQRASVSIMNNIAEGFERDSDKDFIKFLFYAKGSAGEVRSMLYIANDLQYINREEFILFLNEVIEISKLLSGLIKSLKNT